MKKSRHAANSNLIGNIYRIEEMTEGGLSPAEQEAVFKSNGICVSADAIEVIQGASPILREAPLSRAAAEMAIEHHEQIFNERSDEFEEDDEEEFDDEFEEEEIFDKILDNALED